MFNCRRKILLLGKNRDNGTFSMSPIEIKLFFHFMCKMDSFNTIPQFIQIDEQFSEWLLLREELHNSAWCVIVITDLATSRLQEIQKAIETVAHRRIIFIDSHHNMVRIRLIYST